MCALESAEEFRTDEYRFQLADGSYATFHDRGYILRDGHGRPVRMIGAMMDVTKQRQGEKALRQSEEPMRQMAHSIQDIFYVRDAVRGRPRSWLDRVHPEDRERVVRSLNEWKPRRETPEWNEEFRIILPDGAMRWIWIRSFPIRDASGEIVRFAGVERDITERKRAEETVGSLLAITRQLNSTLDVDALMEAVVKETLRLLDAGGGCAGLMTPQGMTWPKSSRSSTAGRPGAGFPAGSPFTRRRT